MSLRIDLHLLAPLCIALAAACSTPAATSSNDKSDKTSEKEKNKKGGDDADDEEEEPNDGVPSDFDDFPEEEKDFLWPFEIHTGYTDGTQVFKVPLETDLTGNLTWTVADPSIAEVTPVDPPADYIEAKKEFPDEVPDLQFAMLTTKKPGTTTVKVSNGSKTAQSELFVRAYTAADYNVGQTRYKTGGTGNRQPCAGCHEKPDGWDHSPYWLAIVPDDEVLGAIIEGEYRWEDEKYVLNNGNHKWNLTEEEKTGILAYLRGLPPRGF